MKEQKDWKFLLVEDGSVDLEELESFIQEKDLAIHIIAYRQGRRPPRLLNEKVLEEVTE